MNDWNILEGNIQTGPGTSYSAIRGENTIKTNKQTLLYIGSMSTKHKSQFESSPWPQLK